MTESKKTADSQSDQHSETGPKALSSGALQWFREGIAGVISVVTLTIAALMLYGTYNYVRETPATADPAVTAARKESYERQKDIMLYALALLGTVTGYYLGRVPAELHAQQAQKSANTAQDQLQKTQTKLSDTADKAATASTQATVAQQEIGAVKAKLTRAADTLEFANNAISKTLSLSPEPRVLGSQIVDTPHEDVGDLSLAQRDIQAALREIRGYSS